jgi:glycerol-3-phosphate acyltransferase PlsY
MFQFALWCLGAFLCGSIPFGLIVVKLVGKGDVRAAGSGNIGATNVSRVAGKGVGVLVLLLDVAKGFGPVFLAKRMGLPSEALSALALCSVAGHIFTPWLRFRGGKGVASALGATLAFNWLLVVPAFLLFLCVVLITRFVSLSSILAALTLPILVWHHAWLGQNIPPYSTATLAIWFVISMMVIAKHHENIKRLLNGTESKL